MANLTPISLPVLQWTSGRSSRSGCALIFDYATSLVGRFQYALYIKLARRTSVDESPTVSLLRRKLPAISICLTPLVFFSQSTSELAISSATMSLVRVSPFEDPSDSSFRQGERGGLSNRAAGHCTALTPARALKSNQISGNPGRSRVPARRSAGNFGTESLASARFF